jgi:biofilm protein TabA
MIYGNLTNWRAMPGFAENAVWTAAFQWLETASAKAADGVYPLGQEGFEARVMSYATKRRDEARFESHQRFIDIQYTIEGAEAIEVDMAQSLLKSVDYDAAKDVEFFEAPSASLAKVENKAGFFTVLFPGEAHMPQLAVPGISAVRKVVVKAPVSLVFPQSSKLIL